MYPRRILSLASYNLAKYRGSRLRSRMRSLAHALCFICGVLLSRSLKIGGVMHACVLTCIISYHFISHTRIHSTDAQQHTDATHTYTRTYIHAPRCMYLSIYVAYLVHPFIALSFIHMTLFRELGTVRPGQESIKYTNISCHCFDHSYI